VLIIGRMILTWERRNTRR